MKQNKQQKILAIVALCVSILGLTLGFAAFSNTLTISSSATVKPNESDFDINIYGMNEQTACDDNRTVESITDKNVSVPDCISTAKSASVSQISDDGKSLTISNINVGFSQPGEYAYYYYIIKNEGEYDAYIDPAQLNVFAYDNGGVTKICTAGTGANADMVSKACSGIKLTADISSSSYQPITGNSAYKLEKGDFIVVEMAVSYDENGERADGDFSVKFDDVVIDFTSVPSGE